VSVPLKHVCACHICEFFPTPVGTPGGKPLRLTARVKIARARPDRFWPADPFFGASVCLSVCVSVGQSVVPNLDTSERVALRTRHSKFLSTGRRGIEVTVPLLALLRSESRRRRAPRPAAGPPTHAMAGTRARAVTMATVRPPSLLNHSRQLASCRAPRLCRLSTPPSSRDGGIE